jgi:hypothetical protein
MGCLSFIHPFPSHFLVVLIVDAIFLLLGLGFGGSSTDIPGEGWNQRMGIFGHFSAGHGRLEGFYEFF